MGKIKQDIDNIVMYKTEWCGDCNRADLFFNDYKIEVVRVDIDNDLEATKIVEGLNNGNRSVPTIVITLKDSTTRILVEPSYEELESVILQ